MLVWIAWDYIFRDKPSLIGSVNGMITGLVAITPSAGFVNGYGAIAVGVIASTIVWMAIRFLSRAPVFRHVDDTLGVIYTHGIAGLCGGLMVGLFADPHLVEYIGIGGAESLPGFSSVFNGGSWTLLRWQAETAAWVIVFSGVMTFILLKIVGHLHARCVSPTRSSRSAITRSTATRSTPRTCPRSADRTRRHGSRAPSPRWAARRRASKLPDRGFPSTPRTEVAARWDNETARGPVIRRGRGRFRSCSSDPRDS